MGVDGTRTAALFSKMGMEFGHPRNVPETSALMECKQMAGHKTRRSHQSLSVSLSVSPTSLFFLSFPLIFSIFLFPHLPPLSLIVGMRGELRCLGWQVRNKRKVLRLIFSLPLDLLYLCACVYVSICYACVCVCGCGDTVTGLGAWWPIFLFPVGT